MQNEIKVNLENSVREDLSYIINYKPIAKAAKSAQHFSKMTVIKPIAINVYPQIYVDLVQRFERDEAIRRLKSLGLRETKFLYASLPKMLVKPQKFREIFSDVAKSHLKATLIFKDEVKENNQIKSCRIIVKNCFFCSEIMVFENLDIPYCTPNAGVYENLYNLKSLFLKNLKPRLIKIDAIKSAEYDGDTCEYQLTAID